MESKRPVPPMTLAFDEIARLESRCRRLRTTNRRLAAELAKANEENAALRAMAGIPKGMAIAHCES